MILGKKPLLGKKPVSPRLLLSGPALVVCLACFELLIHVLTAGNYGYYRDEFYYIDASENLDLGYVDFPPLVAVVTAAVRWLLGDSPVAFHLFPALASSGVVVLAGLMARELGGGRFAQGIAALAALIAPSLLAFGGWLSMDAFDQLLWVSAAYVLLLILKHDQPGLFLLFGLIAGVGLLNKVTILFFGFAVLVALLLTPARRYLRTRWPWLGGAIALAFLLPYAFWQIEHGWPTLEFWRNYGQKVSPDSPMGFLWEQIVTMNPANLLVWPAGLYYYFAAKDGRPYRAFGWIFVILFVLFLIQNAKFYFLAAAYPVLFAAGGLVIERFIRRRQLHRLKLACISFLIIGGIIVTPLGAVPVLPVETVAKLTGPFRGNAGIASEMRLSAQLPQPFAFRFGWEEMVETVAGVHQGLPSEEQPVSCILAGNFGEAGAINFFGPEYGLPRAISGHNGYYVWGPRGCSGEVIISVGVPLEQLETVFEDVERADTIDCEYCMPDEDNLPVYVARDSKFPFEEVWPLFKHYD